MATIVCQQGLQSRLESQLVESRMIRLRLSSPKPLFSQSLEFSLKPSCFLDSNTRETSEKYHHEEITSQRAKYMSTPPSPDLGGWSFLLQSLSSNTSQVLKDPIMEKEKAYVHPLAKRSTSTLSDKSLKLCTENLGSETGSDIVENNSIFFWSPSSSSSSSSSSLDDSWKEVVEEEEKEKEEEEEEKERGAPTRAQQKRSQLPGAGGKKGVNYSSSQGRRGSFPPPLTSMSGSESLQVRPHREDGRLVIKAVKAPSTRSYFQAERSDGRLLLCYVKDSSCSPSPIPASYFDSGEDENDARDSNTTHDEETNNAKNEMIEQEAWEKDDHHEEEVEDFQEDEEEEGNDYDEEDDEMAKMEKGMEDHELQEAGPIGMCSRCKEGEEEKRLLNWGEAFWVATS